MKRKAPCPAIPRRKVQAFARAFDLDLVVLFGSQATGKTHPRSDVDLAVRTTLPYAQRDLAWHHKLWSAVGDLCSHDEVDTVVLNDSDSLMLFEVATDGKALFEQGPATFIEFQSYAARRYWDDEKFRRMEHEYLCRDLP